MQPTFNMDSDSEDDDDDNGVLPKPTAHMYDIEKLRQQTTELLDPTWKDTRNKHLLSKMLELEEPSITPKMVDFLLQDGVCESLLSFVTQVGTGLGRPLPDDKSEQLKLAYKTTMLLTIDEPTEALLSLLGKKASVLTRQAFAIFQENSSGSFFHAFRLIDTLMRCFPAEVYEGICGDGKTEERMSALIRYVGYPPVTELFVLIVALTPIPRASQMFLACARNRWMFFEQLDKWVIMLKLAQAIVHPAEVCLLGGGVTEEMHSTAAVHLLQELVEKLSLEDTGELLLQPLGHTTTFLDSFIDAATDPGSPESLRRSSAKLLCFLLRRAAEPEIMCILGAVAGAPPVPTCLPNRLYPLRERMVLHIESRLEDLLEAVAKFSAVDDNRQPVVQQAVKYPGHSVQQPFSALRATLIELIVLMVESDDTVASRMSVDLLKQFMELTIVYAFNSIFHTLFYRLVFAVLRQNQDLAQRNLLQKGRLITFLIGNCLPYPATPDDFPTRHSPVLVLQRTAARGMIMNCLNAIRLQANCQSSSPFLREFLTAHAGWNEFLPTLTATTDFQQQFGMGIKISEVKQSHNLGSLAPLLTEQMPKPEDSGIDHGSRYARTLGFYDDVPWPIESAAEMRNAKKHLRHVPESEIGHSSVSEASHEDYLEDSVS